MNHPLVCAGNAALVVTDSQLDELIDHLRSAHSFAYDTEFIGELTYIPKLCLIQVATTQRIALIDPLAKVNLTPFWELVCDGSVQKIVHAGQQDLEPALRHAGKAPANIFDTQIASGFTGLAYPSALGKLVKELLGVSLGKGLTFTHWDQRPLSALQLAYAADDVRYLPALHEQIARRLVALDHTAWAAEECASLCDPSLYAFDAEHQIHRIRGAASLSEAGTAVLRDLITWRDGVARSHDVPARSFLRDEILLALARNPVTTVDRLNRIKGLPRPVEMTYGSHIVETIARALNRPRSDAADDRPAEESPTHKFRGNSLVVAAGCVAMGQGIDPDLVANRQDLASLYRHLTFGEPADGLRVLHGWRCEAVGRTLVELFQQQAKIEVTWDPAGLRTRKA